MNLPLSIVPVCESAYRLNVTAREHRFLSVNQRAFYALKNALIKYLYQNHYAIKVSVDKQELICWGCGGEGCYRCDNGIYKTIKLYCFIFDVNGLRFKWHQPADRVDYPVDATGEEHEYMVPAFKADVQLTYRREVTDYMCLYFFLKLHGFSRLPSINGLALWRAYFNSDAKIDKLPF